jgi:ribosomal protein L29
MKSQELKKLHQMTLPELQLEVEKKQHQLVELRIKKNTAQLKDVRQPKRVRQEIAQMKSIIRIKQLVAQTKVNEKVTKETV